MDLVQDNALTRHSMIAIYLAFLMQSNILSIPQQTLNRNSIHPHRILPRDFQHLLHTQTLDISNPLCRPRNHPTPTNRQPSTLSPHTFDRLLNVIRSHKRTISFQKKSFKWCLFNDFCSIGIGSVCDNSCDSDKGIGEVGED